MRSTPQGGGLSFWINVPSDTGFFGLIISPEVAPANVWDGNWHQATGTYDGATVRLYLDGVEVGGGTPYIGGGVGGPEISYQNAGPLVLGNFAVDGGSSWTGDLDEVKVFNRPMEASEVIDTFTNPSSNHGTNGLVSWWRADGNASDSWGSNHGTINASTISFVQGKSGQGFLSAGGAILVPNGPALAPSNITVQAWVKSVNPGNFRYILSKSRIPAFSSYAFYTAGNGGVTFFTALGETGSGSLVLSPAANPGIVWDGAWHQLTGTYDGAAVRLYIDGLEVDLGTAASGDIDYATTSSLNDGALVIANDPSLGFAMPGGIDEVKIWDQALTAEQVLATYTAGELVSWWRAEENADDSVGTNDGSFAAATYKAGKFSGRAFNTAGAVVVTPDSSSLEPAELTVQALVKSTSPGASKYVLSKSLNIGSSSYALQTALGAGLVFEVTTSSGIFSSPAVDASVIWDGQFHAVAGTYDGQSVRLFVDGQEVGVGTAASGAMQYGAGELTFGDSATTPGSGNFVGLIDDVRVYRSARSIEEINADIPTGIMILQQPQSQVAELGANYTLSVSARSHIQPVFYQWKHAGTNLPAETDRILTISALAEFQLGNYEVQVVGGTDGYTSAVASNLVGQAFSLAAYLIDVPNNGSLDLQTFTYQFWARRLGSPGNFLHLIAKSRNEGSGNAVAMYTGGSGGLEAYVTLLQTNPVQEVETNLTFWTALPAQTIWDGNWHQVTYVWDGENLVNYLDGQLFGTVAIPEGGGVQYSDGTDFQNNELIIGGLLKANVQSLKFPGDMDEVKIFNRALSAGEVLGSFNSPYVNPSGLVSLWGGESRDASDSVGPNDGEILPDIVQLTLLSDVANLTLANTPAAIITNVSLSGGLFQATLTGPAGVSYVIQRSTGLPAVGWTSIVTNVVPFTFNDAIVENAQYYRAVEE